MANKIAIFGLLLFVVAGVVLYAKSNGMVEEPGPAITQEAPQIPGNGVPADPE